MEAFILSIILGFTVASIGAWKDTQWEPFSLKAYFRSPLITFIWVIPLYSVFHNNSPILIALSAVSMERMTVESWKGILRKMPSKFKAEGKDTGWVKKRFKSKN